MPKFLRIGILQSNVSGYTSKAWWVRRVGATVFLQWGAVEVRGVGDGRKIFWTLPPQAKTIRCGTEQRAKDYTKAAIARRRNHRYEPLAGSIAIRRRPANRGAELEQTLATILFVDIVRSTEKAARLGDSRWTQVMNHYFAAVRKELKTLRGKEVVTTGDGLLATFDAPVAGVRCATAIREAVRTLGLEIRVGLHAGEYKVSGADESACRRSPGLERGQGPDAAIRNPLHGPRRAPAQRRAEAMAPVPGRTLRCAAKVDFVGRPRCDCAGDRRLLGFSLFERAFPYCRARQSALPSLVCRGLPPVWGDAGRDGLSG
jgi:hypothetical protein